MENSVKAPTPATEPLPMPGLAREVDRRAFIQMAAALVAQRALASSSRPADTAPAPATLHELIRDNHFQQGFSLLDPKPGRRVVYGQLQGFIPKGKPVWDLAQWSSKFPLKAEVHERLADGSLRFANEAKAITLGPAKSDEADLSLAVNTNVEYGNRARQKSEPWVHLLVQQPVADAPPLSKLAAARFSVAFRLKHSRLTKTSDYSPDLHAAQLQLFLSLQNRNRQSPGHGEYLWFGIPFYDNRHRMPPAYKAQDFGDTKMFIFTCAAEDLTRESSHDGKWVSVDKDLLPLMHEGMTAAWSRGFLRGSHQLADYAIANIVLGWEVTGLFDVEMQIRDLSLKVSS
jgi:hypothetical protein